MPCSFIGRHVINNDPLEIITYWMHSILVIPSVITVLLQVLISRNIKFHKRLGKIFKYCIFPLIVLTGMAMTFHSFFGETHLVPLPSVFLCYGYSYTVIGMETLGYMTPRKYTHYAGILCWIKCLHHLLNLVTTTSFELFILLYPIPWIHASQVVYSSHIMKGLLLNYLGLLGTAFTISYDKYWFFPTMPLTLPYRMVIQNLPLVALLVQNIRRN